MLLAQDPAGRELESISNGTPREMASRDKTPLIVGLINLRPLGPDSGASPW